MLSEARAQLRAAFLDKRPDEPERSVPEQTARGNGSRRAFGHADAARAESEAEGAVTVARLALLDAHPAVLDARLARIDAGEAQPGAAPQRERADRAAGAG